MSQPTVAQNFADTSLERYLMKNRGLHLAQMRSVRRHTLFRDGDQSFIQL